jgi:hypothetical protein
MFAKRALVYRRGQLTQPLGVKMIKGALTRPEIR